MDVKNFKDLDECMRLNDEHTPYLNCEILDVELSEEEVISCVKKLKYNKSGSLDNLINEYIKQSVYIYQFINLYIPL